MCTLDDYIKNNDVNHVLLGNGFCKQISEKFDWPVLTEGCSIISKLQKKYNEENLELLLRKCELKEKRDIIESFLCYFQKNHPKGINQYDYNIRNPKCILNTIKQLQSIFTINYDLTLYWLTVREAQLNHKIRDGFLYLNFNKTCLDHFKNTCIYYLHGAVFIYHKDGCEHKFKYQWKKETENCINIYTITDQIKENLHVPVYVFGSSSEKKIEQINKFEYLKYCYNKLDQIKGNFCIFGSSICQENPMDIHIINKILSNNSINTIHIGVHSDPSEIKPPDYLKKHRWKIQFFSTKEYTINDNCDINDDQFHSLPEYIFSVF